MNPKVLFDAPTIAARVEALAVEIAAAMPTEFLAVGVLKGCFVFLADLVRQLDQAGVRPEVEFMRLSSYGRSRESSGSLRLLGEPPIALDGREVLLVDDIADTGVSLAYAESFLRNRRSEEHTSELQSH